FEKITPVPMSKFKFYRDYQAPTQDNLSPVKSEPEQIETIPLESEQPTGGMNDGDDKCILNQIFYGPPGTGKTFKMQSMIKEKGLVKESLAEALNYKTFVSGYYWWELISMVLLENQKMTVLQILDSEVIKSKLAISNIQHPSQRVWSTLQHRTVESCPNVKMKTRRGELVFFKE